MTAIKIKNLKLKWKSFNISLNLFTATECQHILNSLYNKCFDIKLALHRKNTKKNIFQLIFIIL